MLSILPFHHKKARCSVSPFLAGRPFTFMVLVVLAIFSSEGISGNTASTAAKTVDALWALQLDDGEDTAAAAYLTSAAEGEQTTSTFLDQDGKNHPLFRAEDDDYWRPDRYAREALAYSESHDDLLGRTLREKTTRSVWQGVRDKTSETGRALGEQIISDPWGTVKAVGGAIKDDTWEMVRHPIRTAGNIGEGVWTLGKDAAYNLGNSAKSTWAGSFGTENALNTLYGQNMGAPLLGMSAIQASLTAAQVVPAAKGAQALGKGAQALGKGALRAGKKVLDKGLSRVAAKEARQLGQRELLEFGVKRGIKDAGERVGFVVPQNTKALPSLQVPNAGGKIVSDVTKHDEIFFRVFFGKNTSGRFLTKVPPKSQKEAIEGLALPIGNNADFIQKVIVPSGTRLQRSRALPAFGRIGGKEQFQLLENIPNENFSFGVPFK